MSLANEKGQATFEAVFVAPLVILFFSMVAGVAWMAWIRFELSQMGQAYLACLDSNQARSVCRDHFQFQLQALPGAWRYERTMEDGDRLVLSVRSSTWPRHWTFTEGKNWQLPR